MSIFILYTSHMTPINNKSNFKLFEGNIRKKKHFKIINLNKITTPSIRSSLDTKESKFYVDQRNIRKVFWN